MCMIIDGAEQSLHYAPRFNGLAPTRDGCKLKITGAILHGHRATVFVSAPHLPTGANLTCTLIDHVLNDNTTLPPHFRLQVDGASDNWSLVVFAHLEALVRHRDFYLRVLLVTQSVSHTTTSMLSSPSSRALSRLLTSFHTRSFVTRFEKPLRPSSEGYGAD